MDLFYLDLYINYLTKHYTDEEYIEYRPIKGRVKQKFFKKSEKDSLIEEIKKDNNEMNIYIGIQPRSSKSSKKKDISKIVTLWADLDAKDFNGSKEKALKSIKSFELNPTIIVDSGNGYHAYWVLDNPFTLDNDKNIKEVEKISKALHLEIDADSTWDITRILRVPETKNIKNNKNIDCTIEDISSNFYSLEDFKNILDIESIKLENKSIKLDLENHSRVKNLKDLKELVSDYTLDRAKKIPDKFNGDRSSNDFWVCVKLFEQGLNDNEVLDAFKLFAKNNWDAGLKVNEKGIDYLKKYTIPNAKEKSSEDVDDIINRIKNKDTVLEKINASQQVFKKVSQLNSIKRDVYVNKIQDAIGGSSVISKSKIRKEIKKASVNTSKLRFFQVNENGSTKFIPKKLADYILDSNHFIYLNESLYTYEKGYYKPEGLKMLKKIIQELLKDEWSRSRRDEVIDFIRDRVYIKYDNLPNNKGLVCVENGMLDVINEDLLPHDPQYLCLNKLHVEYNPNTYSERLDKFMYEVFDTKAVVDLIWEHAGYILLKDLNLKKFLILVGKGNNGKSVWLNLIRDIIGEENISHQSLQALANNKFSLSKLFGKLANINADLSSDSLKQTGLIKQLTGGDDLSADVKYKSGFTFKNKAKLIFSCNSLPIVTKHNEAFFNRLHIVKCRNEFRLGENADPHLEEKLSKKEAKSAWLNNAIKGAKRLLNNNKFTEDNRVQKNILEYKISNDSVSEFIQYNIENNKGYNERIDEVYTLYKGWCKSRGRSPVNQINFISRAKQSPNNLKLKIIDGKKNFIDIKLTDIIKTKKSKKIIDKVL